MNHVIEPILAGAAVVAVLATALIVNPPNPKPKPEPPVAEKIEPESKQTTIAPDRVQAEPLPKNAAEQKRIDEIAKDVRQAQRDINEIKDALRLKQAVERLPEE